MTKSGSMIIKRRWDLRPLYTRTAGSAGGSGLMSRYAAGPSSRRRAKRPTLMLQIPKYDYVQEKVRERKRLRNLESILKWDIAKYWIGSYNIIFAYHQKIAAVPGCLIRCVDL